jgi:hypothetical protein
MPQLVARSSKTNPASLNLIVCIISFLAHPMIGIISFDEYRGKTRCSGKTLLPIAAIEPTSALYSTPAIYSTPYSTPTIYLTTAIQLDDR